MGFLFTIIIAILVLLSSFGCGECNSSGNDSNSSSPSCEEGG